MKYLPVYYHLNTATFEEKIKKSYQVLNPCRVCPRQCGVNRFDDSPQAKKGFCQTGKQAIVYSFHPHFGEERCLVGIRGSGAIFFSSCNLACVYCQNWEISQLRQGSPVSEEELAWMMIKLQNLGCHNINLVSPTIYAPQIIKAVYLAREKGLELPLVYNSGGYDRVETLKLLERIIDIYMPDIKYSDDKLGLKYSFVPHYWRIVKKAVKEMHRQVGDLKIENGLAQKGLLVRHLILPNNIAGTEKVMKFLAEKISKKTYINIMDQYYPTNKAHIYPELSRTITKEEYHRALKIAKGLGLHRFDHPITNLGG